MCKCENLNCDKDATHEFDVEYLTDLGVKRFKWKVCEKHMINMLTELLAYRTQLKLKIYHINDLGDNGDENTR